jgi:hypothetical protein
MSTEDLIERLKDDAEGPWLDDRSPLTPYRLASLLRPHEITSKQMRIGEANRKGYERAAFIDAWDSYMPDPVPADPKLRNTEQERGFGVSESPPTDEGLETEIDDLLVEDDYPRSAWDPDVTDDDPGDEAWLAARLRGSDGGGPT